MFSARVEGGSVAKPNSKLKKEQALELAQAMGQFANAAPGIIIVMMKMMERAFEEIVISDDEWAMVQDTLMQSLQKAGAGPGAQGGADPNATGTGPNAPLTDEELQAQTAERIRKLPPEAQAKLEEMVSSGMPPAEALESIEAELQPQ